MPTLRVRLAVVTSVFCSMAAAVYVTARAEPLLILSMAPRIMVLLWLCQDAERRRIGVVTDLGFFLLLSWPFGAAWYAFKSRGAWRGLLLLVGLLTMGYAADLTTFVIALFRHG